MSLVFSLLMLVVNIVTLHAESAGPHAIAFKPAHAEAAVQAPDPHVLRVCADPNDLPFSNRQQQGFENAIARLVAHDLGRKLTYVWWPQHRGFARNTLRSFRCDVIMGVPTSYELAQPTQPYYRSTYVFVTRHDRHLRVRSFDDPILRKLKIGIHAIGGDQAGVPPALALAKRGITGNIAGFPLYGDYSEANPQGRLIDAVAHGDVDLAIVWGPLAGYFAKREPVALDIVPVSPQVDMPFTPFIFDISMGVRRGDTALRDALESELGRRSVEIRAILDKYGVPLLDGAS